MFVSKVFIYNKSLQLTEETRDSRLTNEQVATMMEAVFA